MKTVAIIIARMGSTRLPGKVLMELGGCLVLEWVIDACQQATGIDEVWVATSGLPQDDAILEICRINGIDCFRGSESDVLGRFHGAAVASNADVVVRVTGDCPFVDPNVIAEVVALRKATNADYASCIDPPTWPDGLDCEAVTMDALTAANNEAVSQIDRDTVTQFIVRNRRRFKAVNLTCPIPGLHKERWVLDTEHDLRLCKEIAENAFKFNYKGQTQYLQILNYLNNNPWLRKINEQHPRNERFFAALAAEAPAEKDLTTSKTVYERASKAIPLAAQTFSKSKIQFPAHSPLFVTHGDRGHVFDVDGNRYVDLIGGLLPVVLGYRDPDIDAAVRDQLDRGISFSLPTEAEVELSETMCRLIPCAEMVRLGKNGTDVTSAAIRLSRAFTGRDLVLATGYHGWADWAVAHDGLRSTGVPVSVGRDVVRCRYGDNGILELLKIHDYAAVIVEPETDPIWLQALRERCDETGTILIFDEIITGFRWNLGGAQALHGVTPDLATFGKAMGNGMPISALVGKRDIMKSMEKISYSGTMFGEALSIAAAKATLAKIEAEEVVNSNWDKAQKLTHELQILLYHHDLMEEIEIGHGPLFRLAFKGQGEDAWRSNSAIKTLFIQEMARNGVLMINSHNMMHAHTWDDHVKVVAAYQMTLEAIAAGLKKGDIEQRIGSHAIPATANVRYAVAG